jgi:Mg2+-importing ATPase
VSPLQKHAIVQLIQQTHEVGFLGEGINDAPALKAATVALVVQGASDVAQEAADIVLLKKNLEVVVDGIKEGREIFANVVKYIRATLASNFGNFYAVATASFIIRFLPLLPIQILLVNLLSDFPMIAIASDTVDDDELKNPHSYDIRSIVFFATILGLVSTAFDFLFFGLFYKAGASTLQTSWFMGSILTELVFIFSVRTHMFFTKARRPSTPLLVLSGVAACVTIAMPFMALGHSVFKFVSPSVHSLTLVVTVVAVYFITTELAKVVYYRYFNGRPLF